MNAWVSFYLRTFQGAGGRLAQGLEVTVMAMTETAMGLLVIEDRETGINAIR